MKQGMAKALEELFSKYSGSMTRMKREASNLEGKASRGSKTYKQSKEKVKSMWANSPKNSNSMLTGGVHARKGVTAGAMASGYAMSGGDK